MIFVSVGNLDLICWELLSVCQQLVLSLLATRISSLECLCPVPVPLVDFGGWGVDLDGQISYLSLGPVLIFGEGLMQDLDRLPAEPVLRLPPLAITKSLCGRLF